MEDRYLVTGSSGCIGAWAVRRLIDAGSHVVALDVSDDDHRLRLLMSDAELDALARSRTDIRVLADVEQTLALHRITHVVHLAALQVPFCQADPVRGAEVNVVGTTNLLDATFTGFVTAALGTFWFAWRQPIRVRRLWAMAGFGALCGCAVLVKGFPGVVDQAMQAVVVEIRVLWRRVEHTCPDAVDRAQ